jgi:hypothetical protein
MSCRPDALARRDRARHRINGARILLGSVCRATSNCSLAQDIPPASAMYYSGLPGAGGVGMRRLRVKMERKRARINCSSHGKKRCRHGTNHLLHEGGLRLSCERGLAAVGFVSHRRRRRHVAGGRQVPPPEIQIGARHPLWVFCRPCIGSSEFNRFSRSQRAAPRGPGEDEIARA